MSSGSNQTGFASWRKESPERKGALKNRVRRQLYSIARPYKEGASTGRLLQLARGHTNDVSRAFALTGIGLAQAVEPPVGPPS